MTSEYAAGALRALGSALRAGNSARNALIEWPSCAPVEIENDLHTAAQLADLGAPLDDCVRASSCVLGVFTGGVAIAFEIHRVSGVDLAALLDAIADRSTAELEGYKGAVAHAAGARLSARIISLLPVATIPLVPFSTFASVRPRGIVVAALGLALAIWGSRWIARLLPRPAPPTSTWWISSLTSAGLRAGLALPAILDLLTSIGSVPELEEARRRAWLCGSWSTAFLRSSHDDLAALGGAIRRAEQLGAPLADQIDLRDRDRVREAQLKHDEDVRRAPVRMAVPLVLCVLPSFILLGLAPHLGNGKLAG